MANIINRQQTFATNGTVDAASLHNLIDSALINSAIIKNQDEITTIGTSDLLLIAPSSVDSALAPRKVTVQNLVEDAFTFGTYVNLSLSGNLTYATATGNNTISTSATITNGTITNLSNTSGTIATLNSTTGTIATLNSTTGTIATLNSTTGTIATLNSTTGTIGNLSTTLAGDFTISQGTGTLGTSGVTLGTYGGSTSIPTIVVDAKGRVTTASTSAITSGGLTGFRNRIINGDCRIDQRNAGASVTNGTTDAYCLDRFAIAGSVVSKFTAQRSTTVPSGFTNSLLITSSSAYTVGASDFFYVMQGIEGFNVSDLAFGSASAQSITISFWVRSSLTGTFGGAVRNKIAGADRSYPFSYSISASNTWEKKTITVAGDTSGTWTTDNSCSITVCIGLGVGTTFSGTAGAWAGSNLISATGATSVVGTNGATFYITGVQLEAGSTATDFERRPIGTELALCQRYYEVTNALMSTSSWTALINTAYWKVEKRATPTLTATSQSGGSGVAFAALGVYSAYQSVGNSVIGGVTVAGASEL